MNWYAVNADKEAYADLQLRRAGFETWFPFTHEWEPSPKSKTLSELTRVAYFRRYLFVFSAPSMLNAIAITPGVEGILHGAGRQACAIPIEVMQDLFKKLGRSGKTTPVSTRRPKFLGVYGQRFRFGESSKLFGFYGQIVRLLDNARLQIKLESSLFGVSGREIDIPISDVGELEPIK